MPLQIDANYSFGLAQPPLSGQRGSSVLGASVSALMPEISSVALISGFVTDSEDQRAVGLDLASLN